MTRFSSVPLQVCEITRRFIVGRFFVSSGPMEMFWGELSISKISVFLFFVFFFFYHRLSSVVDEYWRIIDQDLRGKNG